MFILLRCVQSVFEDLNVDKLMYPLSTTEKVIEIFNKSAQDKLLDVFYIIKIMSFYGPSIVIS